MKKMTHLLRCGMLALIGLALFAAGCDLKEEPIPAYIHLKPFEMQENDQVLHGSLSSKITHAFVSYGGQSLGVYALPATIPVLGSGSIDLVVDPMIRQNGSSIVLDIYPFYERFTQTLDLQIGQVDSIQPETRYISNANFIFQEDFEAGTPIFLEELDGDLNTFMDITTEEVFEGDRSGMILLTKESPLIEVATSRTNLYNLPVSGGRYYLEVDYKTEAEVLFGLIGFDQTGESQSIYEFGLLPNDEWNKVYFDFTQIVLSSPYENFQMGIVAALPLENGEIAQEAGRIYLDNIKFISF